MKKLLDLFKKSPRFIVLIIYDIGNDKLRNKMVKCLEGYGTRVQKSAFEAKLTKKQYEKLMKESSKIIDKSCDSLRIYILPNRASVRAWGVDDGGVEDIVIL